MMNPEELEAIRLQFKDNESDQDNDDSVVLGEQSLELKREQFEGELEAV